MDFSRLSRESLIHEIEQLNLENERIKLKNIGNHLEIHDCLNDIQSPVFIVNTDFKVLWANKNSSDSYYGILSKKCYQVFFGFDDVCPGCLMTQCASTQSQNEIIVQRKHLDDVDNISVHFSPLIRENKFIGVLESHYINVDLSHLKLDQSEKMNALKNEMDTVKKKYESLSALLQDFSKAMRVPLRSFMGYFQIYNDCDNEFLKRDYLNILKLNSEILYETLNRLLLFSRLELGEITGKREPFSVRRLVEETLKQAVLPSKDQNNSNYHLIYTETLPDVLIGDAFSLKLLISYLLEFAQFISNKAFVEMKISDITQTHSKMALKLSIQTNYHYETKIKLLEYFDVDLNTQYETIEEYSLGLGIYLAKKIIASQNGTIEMAAGLDGIFYIDVTLNYDKVIPRNEEVAPESHQSKKKLLIADFEKPLLSLDIFKSYNVYFAHSGEDAIKQYFKIDPDLTIINVLIENCDGFKVFDEIERRRKRITPIIAISDKLVDNEREFLRDYGFNEYYPKPLSDDKLQNIIENYF